MLHGFHGGVHPAGRKKATARAVAAAMRTPPAQVVLPLCGPGGTAGECLVSKGDAVAVGQLLAPSSPRWAAVHASVSGTVAAVEPRLQPWGEKVPSVVIDSDGRNTPVSAPGWKTAPKDDPTVLTAEDILDIARQAGLAGMGGATFPTSEKLASALNRTDTLILNGAECEPYVTADQRLMCERPEAVLGGARLLAHCLGLEKAVIAVEGDKQDAVAALRALLPVRGGDLEVRPLRTRYPQGSEKQLIQRLTGRRVPSGGLPADVGCAVFNVATAAALYDAVYGGKALTERIVTVAGSAVAEPKNLRAPIGTPLEDLIREAGGWRFPPDRVVAGGPMMGMAQFDLSVPVGKGTGTVLGLTAGEIRPADAPEGPCIRCGRCVEACPMGLQPVTLRLYADAGRWEALKGLHVMDCTECGACTYVCPARIRLVHSIRTGKQHLRTLGRSAGERGGKA